MSFRLYALTSITLATLLNGCAHKPEPARTPNEECRYQIDEGYKDLDRAKSANPSSAADIFRAAAILSAATVQRQFDKFPECIDKATRARELLKPYAQ